MSKSEPSVVSLSLDASVLHPTVPLDLYLLELIKEYAEKADEPVKQNTACPYMDEWCNLFKMVIAAHYAPYPGSDHPTNYMIDHRIHVRAVLSLKTEWATFIKKLTERLKLSGFSISIEGAVPGTFKSRLDCDSFRLCYHT